MRKQKKEAIWEEDEYSYPMAFGFIPNIMAYIHEDGRTRAGMLIVPGGGYSIISPTEGEIVAKKFYEKGFQTFVLTYTSNMLMTTPLKKQPMQDLSRAIRFIRKHAESYFVDPEKLVICGFSAGGHLAAAASTLFTDSTDRPDFSVLIYAAITDDPDIIDRETFGNLLKSDLSDTLTTRRYSCEKQVTDQTPPTFLACSDDDDNVWPGNSTRYYSALKRHGIAAELHVFPTGRHGWGWNPDFKYSEELRTALARWLKTTGENQ